MLTATIKLTDAQETLVRHVVANSPWFKTQAKACTLTSGSRGATLSFQVWERTPIPTVRKSPRHKPHADPVKGQKWQEKRDNSDDHRLVDLCRAAAMMGYPARTCEALRWKILRAARRANEAHERTKAKAA